MQSNRLLILYATLMILISKICHSQTYDLLQDFEDGGSGTDNCWTGFNASSVPTTINFFTTTSVVQSGLYSGGMYSCCGGVATNQPTYYISPVLPDGLHNVGLYLVQSSYFSEDFEIGTVSDLSGANFTVAYVKSTWPASPVWEYTSALVTTNSVNNRVAFRVPPASLKTYYLDSVVVENSGNSTSGCNYSIVSSVKEQESLSDLICIYPNPFYHEIKITSSIIDLKEILLTDIIGKDIFRDNMIANETVLNLECLPKGLYLLKCYHGKEINIFKLLKQ